MRKKTIEEELKEIQAEKNDHIEQLEKQFGHSKAHRYDFSLKKENESRKKSERSQEYDQWQKDIEKREAQFEEKMNEARSKLAKSQKVLDSAKSSSSDDNFTVEDYKKMIELEERELSDEEFDEYCNLCDRFGDASDEVRDKVEELYDILYSSKSSPAITQNTVAKVGSDKSYTQLQNTTHTTNTKHQSVGSFIFPIIFLCFFVAAGLGVTIFAGIVPWVNSTNLVQVTATVESVEGYYRDDGYVYARMLIKYDFNEETYTQVPFKKKVNFQVEEGDTFQIYINSKNPTEVTSNNNGGYAFPTIFGLVFAGFALLMQTMLIVQAVKAKRSKT